MAILNRIEALKDLIQEAVDKGARSVQKIHETIASMPLDALEKRGLLAEQANTVKDVQTRTIGSVYDAIRRINAEIGEMASGIIESLEDHADAQKNIARAEKKDA